VKRIPIHIEVDAPISRIYGEGFVKHRGGYLLFPHSLLRAEILLKDIPPELRKSPLMQVSSSSTFARHGVEIGRSQTEFYHSVTKWVVSHKLGVGLVNFNRFPVLVREGDPVRVMNDLHAFAGTRGSINSKLRLGNEVLELDTRKMPVARVGGRRVPYLDPRLKGKDSPFVPRDIGKGLDVRIGDFIVVLSQDEVNVPKDRFGDLSIARDGLHHLSTKFIHSGFKGKIALEFMAHDNFKLKPGDIIANLHLIKPHEMITLKQYKGKYQEQKTAKPKALTWV
jgi:deoxycytidine triphosphate deaminase